MLRKLSLKKFLDQTKQNSRVAVYQEVFNDRLTPISIYETLKNDMVAGAILESGLQGQDEGRNSFIAFDPIAEFRSTHNTVTKKVGDQTTVVTGNPFDCLRDLLSELSFSNYQDNADFVGNAVGFINYDAVRLFENIPDRHPAEETIPEILFNFYRTTLQFNHQEQKLLITMVVEISDDPTKDFKDAKIKIKNLIKKINSSKVTLNDHVSTKKNPPLTSEVDINDADFVEMVKQAKEFIKKGDAFQIVLSRCFKLPFTSEPFDIYRALRRISPAPYMFYLPLEDFAIVGASPERLVSVWQKQVTTNPIAGTRARVDKNHDEEIKKDLLSDQKELAEHMMLVDLARNDIGAVCEPGSVKVNELLDVKHYSHVSHITSVVTGKLRDNCDAFDALAAAFPAGTLSGAPKIRAMEIIDELETTRRGVYGGTICRLDYQGNLDSCIAIRMAVLRNGEAIVRAGAGIVYDSNPESEAQETRNKAKSMLDAIELAQGGL